MARKSKGRCLKWSKGRKRCLRRAKSATLGRSSRRKAKRKGRCLKWSKGRTRCMRRAKR